MSRRRWTRFAATINGSGALTVLDTGTTVITATDGAVSGHATLTVMVGGAHAVSVGFNDGTIGTGHSTSAVATVTDPLGPPITPPTASCCR